MYKIILFIDVSIFKFNILPLFIYIYLLYIFYLIKSLLVYFFLVIIINIVTLYKLFSEK